MRGKIGSCTAPEGLNSFLEEGAASPTPEQLEVYRARKQRRYAPREGDCRPSVRPMAELVKASSTSMKSGMGSGRCLLERHQHRDDAWKSAKFLEDICYVMRPVRKSWLGAQQCSSEAGADGIVSELCATATGASRGSYFV